MAEPAKSSNAVVPFPDKRVRRRDHELAFLPAALEIVETPPSPTPVSVFYPQNRHTSPRLRVFIDWVTEIFARAAL